MNNKKEHITSLSINSNKKNIYIIKQKEKKDDLLILFNFNKNDEFLDLLYNKKIQIITDFDVDNTLLKKIKTMMYNLVRESILKSRYSETFWYKIAASLLFGIVIFFFAAFFIPDPIPLLDELAISSLAGILFYFLINKLKLINNVSPEKIDLFIKYLDYVQVIKSDCLLKLQNIFNDNYLKLKDRDKNYNEIKDMIKNDLGNISIEEYNEIKDFITIISENFYFKKIKNEFKMKNIYKNKLISKERIIFYYFIFTSIS